MNNNDERDYAEETANSRIAAGERRKITQCEGCFEPLGALYAAGWVFAELDVTWKLCSYHQSYQAPRGNHE